MAEDARAKAERIVDDVGEMIAETIISHEPPADPSPRDRLVAALAAAIEVQWSMHNDCDGWDWRLEALDDALSALRARAGEET